MPQPARVSPTMKPLPIASFALTLLISTPLPAQISSDGSLSTTVTSSDALNFLIENGDRAGDNLFHSFDGFSIPTGGEAYFNNAADIVNIFSRVTGGNISNIDGILRANGTANVFLINPAGIIFGENASLNLGGSFFATTAESVLFSDGFEFSATNPDATPLLTVNIPVGLQMGVNPGDIQVNGAGYNISTGLRQPLVRSDTDVGLQVSEGNTLALVGGNITLNGGIVSAENGRVELGAVSAPDLVQLNPTELDYSNVSVFGNIELTQQSLVEASEIGAIRLLGNNISLQDGSLLFIENQSNQAAQGIEIQATETIEFIETNLDTSIRSGAISDTLGSGAGGDISIIAPQIRGQNNGGNLRAFTFGEGNSGNITVEAEEIEWIGGDRITALIEIRTLGTGDGGNLTVNTEGLTLQSASLINNVNNSGSGSAGNVVINATESVELGPNTNNSTLIGSSTVSASGDAGSITINTPKLTLEGGALISSSTFGAGDAGTVTINAQESITVSGFGVNVFSNAIEPTTIRTAGVLIPEAFRQSLGLPNNVTGSAGAIILNTSLLEVSDGALIGVQHDDIGNAGTLEINAEQILLQGEGNFTASTQSGDGGNITLQVQDLLQLSEGSFIDTEALGEGDGGEIAIASNSIRLTENSSINSSAVAGRGGNINLQIGDDLQLHNGGKIIADALQAGGGGNITVTAAKTTLTQNSTISTNALGSASGGQLNITSDSIYISSGSNLSALTGGSGKAGNIFIQAQEIDILGVENPRNSDIGLIANPSFIGVGSLPGSTGEAGSISITSNSIRISEGGLIAAGTSGDGASGDVEIFASESVELTGSSNFPAPFFGFFTNHPSRISATSLTQAAAGSVSIQTPILSVNDGAVVEVNGSGEGGGGNLGIISSQILLDNNASLQALVAGGSQGNITLNTDDLILSNNATITTNASSSASGGNIEINSQFIFLRESSNISANAVFGAGGNISINTESIFVAPNSTITASSQLGVDGNISINNPDVESNAELIELPKNFSDQSEQIATGCNNNNQSQFIATGRGGIPATPNERLSSDRTWQDLRDVSAFLPASTEPIIAKIEQPAIVEANTWLINAQGNLELVATTNNGREASVTANCSGGVK